MKKTRYLIPILLICGSMHAQERFYGHEFYMDEYHVKKTYTYKDNFVDSFALSGHIKKVKSVITEYNRKLSKISSRRSVHVFDQNGRLTSQVKVNEGKKEKLLISNTRNFNEHGKVSSSNHYYYGKAYFRIFDYNDSLKPVKQVTYNKRGIHFIIETTYNSYNLIDAQIYRNRKGSISHSYRYTYYPNKQFKQIILSGKKGQTQKVWDYSCDESGKAIKNLKDTARICTLKSYLPDGTVVTTSQSFDFHGKPWKTVQHADAQGRTTKYQYFSGKKETLVHENSSTYNHGKLAGSSTSNFYGKTSYKNDIVYDTAGRIISEIHTDTRKTRIKEVYKTTYIYNTQGLVTEKKLFIDKRLTSHEKFSYEFYAVH